MLLPLDHSWNDVQFCHLNYLCREIAHWRKRHLSGGMRGWHWMDSVWMNTEADCTDYNRMLNHLDCCNNARGPMSILMCLCKFHSHLNMMTVAVLYCKIIYRIYWKRTTEFGLIYFYNYGYFIQGVSFWVHKHFDFVVYWTPPVNTTQIFYWESLPLKYQTIQNNHQTKWSGALLAFLFMDIARNNWLIIYFIIESITYVYCSSYGKNQISNPNNSE